MNFPACPANACHVSDLLTKGLGRRPIEVLAADNYLAVFEDEEVVRAIMPDQTLLAQLDLQVVIITAPGVKVDFASRFFRAKIRRTGRPCYRVSKLHVSTLLSK